MKKIVFCVICIVITISALILPCFAVDDVASFTNGDVVYGLIGDDSRQEYPDYPILYFSDDISTTLVRPTYDNFQGFLHHTLGSTLRYTNNQQIPYYLNTGSMLMIFFNNNKVYFTMYGVTGMVIEDGDIYFEIDFEQDFDLFVNKYGQLYIGIFNVNNPNTYISVSKFTKDLYGNIYPFDALPDSFYNKGYMEGWQEGYDIGVDETYEGAYTNAYNKGYANGQASTDIAQKSIAGFFTGLSNMFHPILSIGVGSLTLYSLLGVLVVALVVMLIVKIVRG